MAYIEHKPDKPDKPTGTLEDGYYRLKKDYVMDNGDIFEKGTVVYLRNYNDGLPKLAKLTDEHGNEIRISAIDHFQDLLLQGDYGDNLTSLLEKGDDIAILEAMIEESYNTDYLELNKVEVRRKHKFISKILDKVYKKDVDGAFRGGWCLGIISFIVVLLIGAGFEVYDGIENARFAGYLLAFVAGAITGFPFYWLMEHLYAKYYLDYKDGESIRSELTKQIWNLDDTEALVTETKKVTSKDSLDEISLFGAVDVEHYGDLSLVRTVENK